MNTKIDPCDTMRVNLTAAAVGLQQCTKTESNIIPIPGGDRVIAIGTPAQVRALLAAEMGVPTDPLRLAVREMAAALESREWAEHVSCDPDLEALEVQITELVDRANVETTAARDVLAERRRQIEKEGYTPADDDGYRAAELPRAAASYVLCGGADEVPAIWPWAKTYWKPRDARANYVRAAALLLAEIERIDRAEKGGA